MKDTKTIVPVEIETHRCKGQCCQYFVLNMEYDKLQHLAQSIKDGSETVCENESDVIKIADMLIPLGRKNINFNNQVLHVPREWFTCRHHNKETGDCAIYEQRPSMCRNYPYEGVCEYPLCSRRTIPNPEYKAEEQMEWINTIDADKEVEDENNL